MKIPLALGHFGGRARGDRRPWWRSPRPEQPRRAVIVPSLPCRGHPRAGLRAQNEGLERRAPHDEARGATGACAG